MTYEEWTPGRWWSVVDADGRVWCESLDEGEARASMRPGDVLRRQYNTVPRSEWRVIDPPPALRRTPHTPPEPPDNLKYHNREFCRGFASTETCCGCPDCKSSAHAPDCHWRIG